MDTLNVTTTPAVLDSNFETIKAQLSQQLQDYDFVVTADTVKDAKAKATELNKLSGEIDTRRKEAVKAVSAPIKAFEEQAKGLVGMCQEVRQKILSQVETFEAETLAMCKDLLFDYLRAGYEKQGVELEFQTASVGGMEKLSFLTPKGNLTSAACAAVDELVQECKIRQQAVKLRLSELEVASHRAGLHSPLTREHVDGFLFAPDAEYTATLAKLIEREKARQEETERKAREKLEAEAAQQADPKDEVQQSAPERAPIPEAAHDPVTEAPSRTTQPPSGMKDVRLDLVLQVTVPGTMAAAKVQEQLIGKLREAGIESSIVSCTARDLESQSTEAA